MMVCARAGHHKLRSVCFRAARSPLCFPIEFSFWLHEDRAVLEPVAFSRWCTVRFRLSPCVHGFSVSLSISPSVFANTRERFYCWRCQNGLMTVHYAEPHALWLDGRSKAEAAKMLARLCRTLDDSARQCQRKTFSFWFTSHMCCWLEWVVTHWCIEQGRRQTLKKDAWRTLVSSGAHVEKTCVKAKSSWCFLTTSIVEWHHFELSRRSFGQCIPFDTGGTCE